MDRSRTLQLFFIIIAGMCLQGWMNSKQNDDLNKLRSNILKLEKKIKEQETKESKALEYIDAIDQKISLVKEFISKLEKAAKNQRKKINAMQEKVELHNKNLVKFKSGFSKRIISLYKHGRFSTLQILLNAESYEQLRAWAKYQRRLAEYDANKISSIKDEQFNLVTAKNRLELGLKTEEQFISEKKSEENSLLTDRVSKDRALKKIRNDKRHYRNQIEDYKKAIEEIQRLIASAEAEEKRRKAEEAKNKIKIPNQDIKGFAFKSLKGRLPRPANGKIIQGYGTYQHPVLKTVTDNLGIDIEVAQNSQIRTVAAGKVTAITWQRSRGNLIIVNHADGYYTVYTNIDKILVDLQEEVRQGQVLGTIGEIGGSKRPVFHFQIWHKFNHMNPEAWLRKI